MHRAPYKLHATGLESQSPEMEAETKPEPNESTETQSQAEKLEGISLKDTKSDTVRSGKLDFTALPLDVKKCVVQFVLIL